MTTLKTLLAYLKLHEKLEEFFYEKCTEFREAEHPGCDYLRRPGGDFDSFEVDSTTVVVRYRHYCGEIDSYYLPLDILFDDDFDEKMKSRFDVKRQEEEERKREVELKTLEELKRKYHDV